MTQTETQPDPLRHDSQGAVSPDIPSAAPARARSVAGAGDRPPAVGAAPDPTNLPTSPTGSEEGGAANRDPASVPSMAAPSLAAAEPGGGTATAPSVAAGPGPVPTLAASPPRQPPSAAPGSATNDPSLMLWQGRVALFAREGQGGAASPAAADVPVDAAVGPALTPPALASPNPPGPAALPGTGPAARPDAVGPSPLPATIDAPTAPASPPSAALLTPGPATAALAAFDRPVARFVTAPEARRGSVGASAPASVAALAQLSAAQPAPVQPRGVSLPPPQHAADPPLSQPAQARPPAHPSLPGPVWTASSPPLVSAAPLLAKVEPVLGPAPSERLQDLSPPGAAPSPAAALPTAMLPEAPPQTAPVVPPVLAEQTPLSGAAAVLPGASGADIPLPRGSDPPASIFPQMPALGPQLVAAVARFPDRPVEVTLSPEELGRVRLTLSTSEAGLVLAVTAERPETLDLMRRNIDQLARDFRELGFSDLSFSFTQQDRRPQADPQAILPPGPATPGPADVAAPAPSAPHRPAANGGLDLRI